MKFSLLQMIGSEMKKIVSTTFAVTLVGSLLSIAPISSAHADVECLGNLREYLCVSGIGCNLQTVGGGHPMQIQAMLFPGMVSR